jgi:hypothetical protein
MNTLSISDLTHKLYETLDWHLLAAVQLGDPCARHAAVTAWARRNGWSCDIPDWFMEEATEQLESAHSDSI